MDTNSNIYGFSRRQTLERHDGRISGSRACLFLALGSSSLAEDARIALTKSAESLGYGPDGATFLEVDQPEMLSPETLFEVVEGLDPLCIVIGDELSASMFAEAYRIVLPHGTALRAFGREVRLLPALEAMMETPSGKQQAWAALKTLPRLGS